MSQYGKAALGLVVSPAVLMLLLAAPSGLLAQRPSGEPRCQAVEIVASLDKGQTFQQAIGLLTLKMEPLTSSGWDFSLVDSNGDDYIYPVNPPLRFNGSQTLGAGYGDSAKTSLSHRRELRFLLSRADYMKFEPLLNDALWPYQSSDPDRALDRYETALDRLSTGLLRLTATRSEISADDEVRSAQFRLELIAPVSFEFDDKLKPHRVACPQSVPPNSPRP